MTRRQMTRREFVGLAAGAAAAALSGDALARAAKAVVEAGRNGLAPTGFVAHGAPLLALDPVKGGDLLRWAQAMPRPRSILVVSAHWERAPASLGPTVKVPLIYDFYGFPRELYEMTYPAPADPALAKRVEGLLKGIEPVVRQPERGLDHGTWVPLRRMYPEADVPVLQLSLPTMDPARLFKIGRALAPLRRDGVLILGSGNLTHNLGMADWDPKAVTPAWASEFDAWIKETLVRADADTLIDYQAQAPAVAMAHPTREHFVPILVAAGAAAGDRRSAATFPIEGFEFGSIARRTVQFG